MENIETLTGKYGDEGDQLLFKILNSRMYESKSKDKIRADFETSLEKNINSENLTEKALRYDLTVPFARYVVQHRNEITIPFKRFQIQPVWRADKPQKGRYREFFQCDADVIGSNSLNNEIELIHLTDDVFAELGISVLIKVNNRKILSGIAEICGAADKITDITVAIDKLDKTSVDAVITELTSKGIAETSVEKIKPLFAIKGNAAEKISFLKAYLKDSAIGLAGVNELEYVLNAIEKEGLKKATIEPDITLARGLNYYTGAIFEVKSMSGELKVSICGGGRYDDLTGIFGWKDMSGVGISFGADRIYDVMNELNLFPAAANKGTQVLFVNFGNDEEIFTRALLSQLRDNGLRVEFYPDSVKMARQMKYANDRKIPFVVIIGSNERLSGICQIKNMETGEQSSIAIKDIQTFFADKLKQA
jgi:histidyl-tRNA synthetase